jgi:hypothetical protein
MAAVVVVGRIQHAGQVTCVCDHTCNLPLQTGMPSVQTGLCSVGMLSTLAAVHAESMMWSAGGGHRSYVATCGVCVWAGGGSTGTYASNVAMLCTCHCTMIQHGWRVLEVIGLAPQGWTPRPCGSISV